MNLSELKITYPSTLDKDQKRYIFDSFRQEFSAEVDEWIEIEKGRIYKGEDGLKPISILFRKYIMENTSCVSQMATSSLFMDMREIINNELS